MNYRYVQIMFALLLAACTRGTAKGAVLSGVEVHFISGPIALNTGQSASACAVNPDDSPISVLIALLEADTSSLLASRQITLQPGIGVCIAYSRTPGPQAQQFSPNVYAVVIPNGRLDAQGRIVQDRPGGGGGCIVASLQIQTLPIGNVPAQTIAYAQMIKHLHTGQ